MHACVYIYIPAAQLAVLRCPCCGYWSGCWYLPYSIHFSEYTYIYVFFFHKKMDKTWKYSKWVHHFCMIWKWPPMLISLELVTEAERSREMERHQVTWLIKMSGFIVYYQLFPLVKFTCVYIYIHNLVISCSTFL